jgi:hypothetical protein
MLRRVALVRTDNSEELGASFIRVTRIGELGTTLAVTSNRRTQRRNTSVTSQKRPFFKDTFTFTMAGALYKTNQIHYNCGQLKSSQLHFSPNCLEFLQ